MNFKYAIAGLAAFALILSACADEPADVPVDDGTDTTEPADGDEDAAADDEETSDLFMISYGGELQVPHREFLADPFEERHNATVTLVPSEDADFVAQIMAARGASPYDVVPLGEPRLPPAIEQGWLAEIDEADVPNAADTYPQFLEACKGYGVPATYSLIGLAYDPERVPAPTSWEDFWNEEYDGHRAMTSSASNLGFGFLLLTAMLNGGDESNMEPIWDALDDLEPFVVAPSPRSLAQLFERGEAGIAPLWNNDAAVLAESGFDVEFVLPEPGGIAIVSCMGMVAETANPELSLELINDVASVEYQEQAARLPWAFGVTNMNANVPEESLSYIPSEAADVEALIQFDWETAAEGRSEVTERFNQQFAS